jgi:hypothetical protein
VLTTEPGKTELCLSKGIPEPRHVAGNRGLARRDITAVGRLNNDIGLCRYRYLWSDIEYESPRFALADSERAARLCRSGRRHGRPYSGSKLRSRFLKIGNKRLEVLRGLGVLDLLRQPARASLEGWLWLRCHRSLCHSRLYKTMERRIC